MTLMTINKPQKSEQESMVFEQDYSKGTSDSETVLVDESNRYQMLKNVKLPTIAAPVFNGKYKTCISFRDSFQLIHT